MRGEVLNLTIFVFRNWRCPAVPRGLYACRPNRTGEPLRTGPRCSMARRSNSMVPGCPIPFHSCQRRSNNTRGIPMSNRPRSRRMGRKQREGAHKTVRSAERRKFAGSLDGCDRSTLDRGFARCSASCLLSTSTGSEFVHVASRSIRSGEKTCE